jgi:hypothetical protein
MNPILLVNPWKNLASKNEEGKKLINKEKPS